MKSDHKQEPPWTCELFIVQRIRRVRCTVRVYVSVYQWRVSSGETLKVNLPLEKIICRKGFTEFFYFIFYFSAGVRQMITWEHVLLVDTV